jgi:deoxyribodipyrimidine photo-lyase
VTGDRMRNRKMSLSVDRRRVAVMREGPVEKGPVLYIMARDQRVDDNWALLFAQENAIAASRPLMVAAAPMADHNNSGLRQVRFSLDGLKAVEKKLSRLQIPMLMFAGRPETKLPVLVRRLSASAVIFDFSPLRRAREWREGIAAHLTIPVYEVDAHNIVPCRHVSAKQEYAAYTLRPKINRQLPEFLTDFPNMVKHPFTASIERPEIDWRKIESLLVSDRGIEPVELWEAGEKPARLILDRFLSKKLPNYGEGRNNPNLGAQSDLSPYLHFGQISAQRIALEAQRYDSDIKAQEAFLEELIVRRELADNFCYYNRAYDTVDGFPDWARKTLDDHRLDPRPYIYNIEQLDAAATHDDLWNAAQMEMVQTGKMHGYLRMYWAKKIMEWSISPETALDAAIYLNDKYELDGGDPNGYAGIAWSIGGVHDRPWFEREIFGKIRYMSYGGCKRKFDIEQYAARVAGVKVTVRP